MNRNTRLAGWWCMVLGFLALFATPAFAHFIDKAVITKLSCDSYTLRVTGVADKGYRVDFSFTLTPGSGPSTTVTGSIPVEGFDTSVTGTFTLATGGVFTAAGTATLKDGFGNIANSVPIDFGSNTSLNCPSPPTPRITIEKFTNGYDGDNASGLATAGQGDFSTGTNTVAEVPPGGAITWTYRVTNTGAERLVKVRVTDDRVGLINCPKDYLAVGEQMDCTVPGTATILTPGLPNVEGCGDKRPTYSNTGTVNAVGEGSGSGVTASDPSHYCNPKPPACALGLTKSCEIVQPPAPALTSCKGKLQRFTLIWPSNQGAILISGIANDAQGGIVNPGQRVTFTGPFAVNDLYLDITGAVTGQSTFHVSCSDRDMDGLTSTNLEQPQVSPIGQDCGKFEGNGKAKSGSWINAWLFDGLVDAEGKSLNCSRTPTPPTASCSFQEQEPPQCGTGGTFKPTTLTFQYSGGGCSTQSNSQAAGKTSCSGSINPLLPVTVSPNNGDGPFTVAPGGTFTINRNQTETLFTLNNAGGTEIDKIHTSCSQPLIVGDVYFSLTLVAENGIGPGKDVKYSYTVTNTGGGTVSNIAVVDDKLGTIGSIASLNPGASQTLTKTTLVSQTTTNVATVTASSCAAPGVQATATVTVLPPPPCTVTQTFDRIEDDKYKVKLTNTGSKVATLDELVLNWPAGATYESIKEVKLDGGAYQADKSSLVVTSGVPIKAGDWTQADVSKRQLNPGETRTLEIVFKKKWPKANCPDGTCFSGTAAFKEGCDVDLSQ